jgi:hypothetical protein
MRHGPTRSAAPCKASKKGKRSIPNRDRTFLSRSAGSLVSSRTANRSTAHKAGPAGFSYGMSCRCGSGKPGLALCVEDGRSMKSWPMEPDQWGKQKPRRPFERRGEMNVSSVPSRITAEISKELNWTFISHTKKHT